MDSAEATEIVVSAVGLDRTDHTLEVVTALAAEEDVDVVDAVVAVLRHRRPVLERELAGRVVAGIVVQAERAVRDEPGVNLALAVGVVGGRVELRVG